MYYVGREGRRSINQKSVLESPTPLCGLLISGKVGEGESLSESLGPCLRDRSTSGQTIQNLGLQRSARGGRRLLAYPVGAQTRSWFLKHNNTMHNLLLNLFLALQYFSSIFHKLD
jgi:hypothetical protein